MRVYERLIISGGVVEHFKYQYASVKGEGKVNNVHGRSSRVVSELEQVKNRLKVLSRARTVLRRLINANAWRWYDDNDKPYIPKFYTFTFAENVTDLNMANYEWKKFRQKLEYKFGFKLKYVVVVEFQKRGAIHYHSVFFNLPYIPVAEVSEVWGHGFIKVNAIDNCDNIGAYVSKYMGKDVEDERLKGEKCYFSSRGLHKPIEVLEQKKIAPILQALCGYETYDSTFLNDYLGEVVYRQYNTNKVLNKSAIK